MTEINKKLDLAAIPPTNNDGDPYILPLDIYKEGYQAYNISNWFKGRVGDNGTPFAIRWYSHGRLLNIHGMRPFIEGQVGDYTIDDSDSDNVRIDMAEDASNIHIVGDVDDSKDGGVAIYRLISQAFPKSGIFYGKIGFMGTQDDGTLVNTGVDIVFKVLAGHMNMLGARQFYVSELEKAWLDLQEKIRQYDQQYKDQTQQQADKFKQETEQALADLNTKIANEIKRAEDTLGDTQASIDANLASLKLLATHIGALEAQLAASDVVSVSDFKAKTDYLDNSINNRLKQIDTNIEAFSDLSALSAKYPNGQPGLFYAAGHLYIYNNGWVDQGAYPSAPLTENEKEILNNAIFTKAFLYDSKQVVAPYNDADLFPTNTVITFAVEMTKVLHVPTQFDGTPYLKGTFITIGNSKDETFHDEPKDGTFQEFISPKGYKMRRMLWEGNWSEWIGQDENENSKLLYDVSQIQPPYDDLNTLPSNSTVVYACDTGNVKNAPAGAGFNGFTIRTMGLKVSGGRVQFLFAQNGFEYNRILWNDKYQDWRQIYNRSQTNIWSDKLLSSNYTDAFELPADSHILYSVGGDKVKNYPPEESKWSSVISQSPTQDIKTASLQFVYYGNGHIWSNVNNGSNHSGWAQIKTESPSDKEFKLAKVSLSMFGKFGVIGDSYASGTLEDFKNFSQDTFADTPDEMKNNLCWGEMLARKWGTSMLHLAKHGLHTRSWLTDDQGLAKLNSSDPQDIYYLVLGINDYYGLGENYLGQESDIENKSDTFYGNYGKIINAIKQKAPLAKIIMFGVAGNTDLQNKFSNAQEKIAEHFHIPFISENEDPLFSSDYYTSSMGSGHPSSYLYGAMANAFERLIQLAVYRYRPYFYNYGWNGKIADPTNIKIVGD